MGGEGCEPATLVLKQVCVVSRVALAIPLRNTVHGHT